MINYKEIVASIIIPTYNGEEFLDEILVAIFKQKTNFKFEVLIIDSGSKDRTLEIVNKYPVILHRIKNKDFNHGETRNLGAELTSGKYLVYLTQDATPATEDWLNEFVNSFSLVDNIGNVLGKQIPRTYCSPTIKRNIEETFKNIGGGRDELTFYKLKKDNEGKENYEKNKDVMRFNSDVNAAYSRNAWSEVRFRKIAYCEDQLMGQDILEAGFVRVYNPKAGVYHSHTYKIKDFLRRFFDEYRGLNIAFGYVDKINLFNLIPSTFYGWIGDLKYIHKQGDFSWKEILYWDLYSLPMNFFRRLGAYFGGRNDSLPKFIKKRLSLEENNKNKKFEGV